MRNSVILSIKELNKYGHGKSFADAAAALLKQQQSTWELLSNNYEQLKNVEVKNFEFDGFNVKVQFNPGRITSSSAKVDKKSIEERKCFLCIENLPKEQRGLTFEDYTLLCNPFPIFPEHFTIPKISHTSQMISGNFESMLKLSKELGEHYSLFYNGPKCGASAPDHMHFQAGSKYFMPIESDYENYIAENKKDVFSANDLSVSLIKNYLRNIIVIESSDSELTLKTFNKLYDSYNMLAGNNEEPLLNVISTYEKQSWRIFVIPREKHRPDYFFAEGENQILLSPASVDLGGVCITPLEKDFEKITKDQIEDIYRQVCLSDDKYSQLINRLAEQLRTN